MDAPTRVLTAVNHEEPDRVPAFESAITNNTIKAHFGAPDPGDLLSAASSLKTLTDYYVKAFEFHRTVKIDIVLSEVSLFPRKMLDNGNGWIDEYGRIMKFETYKGDGTQILGYYGGHFKSFEDYESFELPDPNNPARLMNFSVCKEAQKKLNNEVFVIPATGSLMEVTWEGFGIETFSRILAKRKHAKKVFDDRGKFALELVKILVENGAQMVLLWDDYGFKNGPFMSPENYRRYVFPWIKKICDTAHKHGSKVLLHSDGDLMEIFDDIIDTGVDALNPIEPTTANPDYDIFKLNQKYGDRLTFVGNISPVMLATGEISEIKEYSKRLIREIAPGGGYIFSSGHSINPAVTVDRWQAVLDIREKYGKYPINIPDENPKI
ncbi:MAG: uroporphyrinogen decarboxylase family protein [Promethearchaeota archaeon]